MIETIYQRLRQYTNRWGRNVLAAALLLGSLAVLVVLVAREWDTLRTFEWQLNPLYLALAVLCHVLSYGGTWVVWRLTMVRLGSPASARADLYAYCVSMLARKIPSVIWYSGTRSYLYRQEQVTATLVINAIALEFCVTSLTGAWTYVAFQPLYAFPWARAWLEYVIWGVALAFSALLLIRPQAFVELTLRLGRRWQQDLQIALPGRGDIALWSFVYLLVWTIGGTSFYWTVRALVPGVGLDWANGVGIATLVTLVVLFNSVVPIGLGVKELTTGLLLSHWLPMSVGLLVAVAYRILQTSDELLWAAAAYLLRPRSS
ncbi:MAG: flippase-like domain-containing protein [Anaerolineae bacterium]|nr:flippase-like domain-containing protein [Anaerolineae bacterium]